MPWTTMQEIIQVAEELATGREEGTLFAFRAFLFCGQRQRLEEVSNSIKKQAEITGEVYHIMSSMWIESLIALFDGRFEDTIDISERILIYGKQNNLPGASDFVYPATFVSVNRLGRYEEFIHSELGRELLENVPTRTSPRRRSVLAITLDQFDGAKEALEQVLVERPDITSKDDLTQAIWDENF